jgi:hypothetical protein
MVVLRYGTFCTTKMGSSHRPLHPRPQSADDSDRNGPNGRYLPPQIESVRMVCLHAFGYTLLGQKGVVALAYLRFSVAAISESGAALTDIRVSNSLALLGGEGERTSANDGYRQRQLDISLTCVSYLFETAKTILTSSRTPFHQSNKT